MYYAILALIVKSINKSQPACNLHRSQKTQEYHIFWDRAIGQRLLYNRVWYGTCHFFELLLDFIFPLGFGDIAYKQARFRLANVYFKGFAFCDLIRIELKYVRGKFNKKSSIFGAKILKINFFGVKFEN